MQMLKKRGISPLIATILIIGFTVALAAVIMTWGQSFTKSITEGTEASTEEQLVCAQDVTFDISDACYGPVGCVPGVDCNEVTMFTSNNGNKQIESLKVRLFTSANSVQVVDVVLPLATYEARADVLTPLTDPDLIKKLEVLPVVKIGEKSLTCPNSVDSFGDEDLVAGVPLAPCI